jgi:hypothetical protein
MPSHRGWMFVGLLMLPASACDTVSRYLAGMDDPMYFTWKKAATSVHATIRHARQRRHARRDSVFRVSSARTHSP